MVPLWQKKSVWQVTTIIQPALCHLVTSHFQEIACNWTPKDQIRWPIFLMLLCMIVLTEKNVKISTTYYFLDFSFFMSQDDAHYQNHLNAPFASGQGWGIDPSLTLKSFQLPYFKASISNNQMEVERLSQLLRCSRVNVFWGKFIFWIDLIGLWGLDFWFSSARSIFNSSESTLVSTRLKRSTNLRCKSDPHLVLATHLNSLFMENCFDNWIFSLFSQNLKRMVHSPNVG